MTKVPIWNGGGKRRFFFFFLFEQHGRTDDVTVSLGGGSHEQILVSYGDDYDEYMYFSISLLELLSFLFLFCP